MSKLSRIKHISDWISFLKKKCGISANNFAFSYLPQKHCCISSSCITAISVSVTLSFNCLHLAQVSIHSAFNQITQIRKDLKKNPTFYHHHHPHRRHHPHYRCLFIFGDCFKKLLLRKAFLTSDMRALGQRNCLERPSTRY